MKTFTVDDVLKLEPCEDYTRERLEELFAGRKRLTLADVVDMQEVPAEDVVWLACKIFTQRQSVIFACKCAEDAGMSARAARDAAWAAWDAAWAARDAAWAARGAERAARDAAWDACGDGFAARDAAYERQLLFIAETILETEGDDD